MNKGDDIVASQWQQIIDALTGAGNSPLSISGVNDAANYALTVRNQNAAGPGHFRVRNSGGTADIFQVTDGGTYLVGGTLHVDTVGGIRIGEVTAGGTLWIYGQSVTSASSGSASALPSPPAGYLKIIVDGSTKRVPYYN